MVVEGWLKAIQSIYKCTKNVLKTLLINASISVRQGALSSCFLFIIYIDEMVKSTIGNDGHLNMLHALLLMDNTVQLATNRQLCTGNLKLFSSTAMSLVWL